MATDSTTGWAGFLFWTEQFRDLPDFDQEEREYKARAVAPLAVARDQLAAGDEWLTALSRGFKNPSNNIVSHWAYLSFLDWCGQEAERAAEALAQIWSDQLVGPAAVEAFASVLPPDVTQGSGSRCNLASYLLASCDLERWPVYRITAFRRACDLTRHPRPEAHSSPGALYDHALVFVDEMLARAAVAGLELRDRLDAQSLIWCVTQWQERPKSIPQERWAELLLYRTIPSKLRKPSNGAKATVARRPPRPVCPLCANDYEVRMIGRLDDRSWEFVCEAGSGHGDPLPFEARA